MLCQGAVPTLLRFKSLRSEPVQLYCVTQPRGSLIRDGQRVIGVTAQVSGRETEFRAARGVILAAGDYAGNPQLIAAHKGDKYQHIEGINPQASGDGHRLAGGRGRATHEHGRNVWSGVAFRTVGQGESP